MTGAVYSRKLRQGGALCGALVLSWVGSALAGERSHLYREVISQDAGLRFNEDWEPMHGRSVKTHGELDFSVPISIDVEIDETPNDHLVSIQKRDRNNLYKSIFLSWRYYFTREGLVFVFVSATKVIQLSEFPSHSFDNRESCAVIMRSDHECLARRIHSSAPNDGAHSAGGPLRVSDTPGSFAPQTGGINRQASRNQSQQNRHVNEKPFWTPITVMGLALGCGLFCFGLHLAGTRDSPVGPIISCCGLLLALVLPWLGPWN